MNKKVKAYKNALDLIGKTPLVKLNKIVKHIPGNFYAKVEALNPGHSNKDRIALHIIESAERKGLIKPGATIIETTSGNTGFSIAMVSIIKGYECILAVSSKSSQDKIDMLKAMGATNWKIRKIFLINAAYLIALGLFWGNLVGVGLCFLQDKFKLVSLPQEQYYIEHVPINLELSHVLLLNVGTLVLCTLMLVIPSYFVSKIAPIKALRFN